MTEFLMVCSEEALEPWQMGTGIIEIDDDDDDPIFVREVVWLDPPQKTGPALTRKRAWQEDAGRECARQKRAPPEQPDSGHTSTPRPDLQTSTASSTTSVTGAGSPQRIIINDQLGLAIVPVKSPVLRDQPSHSQPTAQSSPFTPQPAAQSRSSTPQPDAQSSSSTPQPAAQSSSSTTQPAAQSSPSTPQPAAQSSPSTPQPAAQSSSISLLNVTQIRLVTPLGTEYPAGTFFTLRPGCQMLQQGTSIPSPSQPRQPTARLINAVLQSSAQPSPITVLQTVPTVRQHISLANLPTTPGFLCKPAALPSPVSLQKAVHTSSAIQQTDAFPIHASLQTAVHTTSAIQHSGALFIPASLQTSMHTSSAIQQLGALPIPASLQTAVHTSSAIQQLGALPIPASLQTTVHTSSAIQQSGALPNPVNPAIWQPAAQPSAEHLKRIMHPSHGTLQATQTGPHAIHLQLPAPPKLQAPPTSQVAKEACSPGGAQRDSRPHPLNSAPKRTMPEFGTTNGPDDTLELKPMSNKCPSCKSQFSFPHLLRGHMKECCFHLINSVFPRTSTPHTPTSQSRIDGQGKLVMLVSEFYYGNHKGDWRAVEKPKTDISFTCPTCFRVLKNNIGFLNHMRHHLELLWQSEATQDSHTTCQHCYRRCDTPLQLQLHTERAHTQYESTTTCKICELAFETEQVFLEHMRDTHKPGEMPYSCQVCNYRSSFFSEVENHFRTEHENTKDLLCPFCLKVLVGGQVYAKHYMKHQDKEVHQCEKCRLNFLSSVERVAHDALFHRTFKKPRILKGLPLGTEVVIRASLSGTSHSDTVMSHSANTGTPKDLLCTNPGPLSPYPLERSHKAPSLSYHLGEQTCVECSCKIWDFSDHFTAVMNCGECKYRTSCFKSLQNHKIRLHGALPRDGIRRKHKKSQGVQWGITSLECLNCGFLTDPPNGDLMIQHLTDRSHHSCRVIGEKGTLDPIQMKSKPDIFIGSLNLKI